MGLQLYEIPPWMVCRIYLDTCFRYSHTQAHVAMRGPDIAATPLHGDPNLKLALGQSTPD